MSQTQAMREELTALYAQTDTEELLERYQPDMLTDIAAEVMKQELIKRGVTPPEIETHQEKPITAKPASSEASPQLEDWIILSMDLMPTEAHILKARLEAEGIPALVSDEHFTQFMSFISSVTHKAKVKVPANFVEQAKEVMQALERGDFAIDESDAPEKPEQPMTSEYIPTRLKIIRNDNADTQHNPYAAPREFRDQGYYEETDEYGTVREVLSPQTRKQQLYTAFAQDKYYPVRWEGGVNWLSFNFSALIFGFIWCFFRKLYVVGLIVLATEVLIIYLINIFSPIAVLPFLPLIAFLMRLVLVRLPLAIMANGLYGQHAEKKISTLLARDTKDADLLKALHKAGGISIGGMLIGGVLQFTVSMLPLH